MCGLAFGRIRLVPELRTYLIDLERIKRIRFLRERKIEFQSQILVFHGISVNFSLFQDELKTQMKKTPSRLLSCMLETLISNYHGDIVTRKASFIFARAAVSI